MLPEVYGAAYLDNGLGLLLCPSSGQRVAHLSLYSGQSVVDEDPKVNGITHFLEHLLANPAYFGGKLARVWERLKSAGAQLEAWTAKEYTSFHLILPPEKVGEGLDLLAFMVDNTRLRQPHLESERRVVLDEIARRRHSPEFAFDLLEASLFQPPYAQPILGSPQNLEGFELSDLRRWASRVWMGHRVHLVVWGRFREEEVLHRAHETLGALEPGAPRGDWPAVEWSPRWAALPGNGPRVKLFWGFPAPSWPDPERPAAELLAHLLGQGLESLLFRELRQKRGLAYAVGSGLVSYRGVGYLYLAFEAARERVREGFMVAGQVVASVRNSLLSPNGLEGFKQSLAMARLREEGMSLYRRSAYAFFGAELYFPHKEAARYQNLLPEDVHRVAKKYLDVSRSGLLGIGLSEKETDDFMAILGEVENAGQS